MVIAHLILMAAIATTQQPPRDRVVTPGIVLEGPAREAELQKRIAASPRGIAAYHELAKLQEDRGAYAEAEATLLKARQIAPTHKPAFITLAAFYNRQRQFDKAMEVLDALEQSDPADAEAPYIVAIYYWEKAFKDNTLLPAQQLQYIQAGIAATDRALALNPDYVEALTYKNVLLRMRASLETDPFQKQQLIAEADALRARAIELGKARTAIGSDNRGI